MVEKAIPLDPKCANKRSEQMEARAWLRLEIEALLRKQMQYDPRTEFKHD